MRSTALMSRPERTAAALVRRISVLEAPWGVLAIIGLGWLIAVMAQLTGQAGLLHHHELIEGSALPIWLAAIAFLAGWQVMIAGMMLPASLPAVRAFGTSRVVADRAASARPDVPWGRLSSGRRLSSGDSAESVDRAASLVGFLLAYVLAWTAFGLVAFVGDARIHQVVHATPWLQERQWLIEAAVLFLAGAYQFLPWKRRGLAACRHPAGRVSGGSSSGGDAPDGFGAGFRHAVDCVASSWALMLLMFAAGFANLAWMAILAAVMAYEATGRHGQRVASAVGVALLAMAATVVWSGLAGFSVLASVM